MEINHDAPVVVALDVTIAAPLGTVWGPAHRHQRLASMESRAGLRAAFEGSLVARVDALKSAAEGGSAR